MKALFQMPSQCPIRSPPVCWDRQDREGHTYYLLGPIHREMFWFCSGNKQFSAANERASHCTVNDFQAYDLGGYRERTAGAMAMGIATFIR